MRSIAVLQGRIEQIPGVRRTWVEWIIDEDDEKRVLVVEVDVRVHPRAMGLDDEPIPEDQGNLFGVGLGRATKCASGSGEIPPRDFQLEATARAYGASRRPNQNSASRLPLTQSSGHEAKARQRVCREAPIAAATSMPSLSCDHQR